MNGRRIKIYHKGIDKLCTRCFGTHRKSECKEPMKIDWIDYVKNFMTINDYIPKELYGRWNELVENSQKGKTSHRWNQKNSVTPNEQDMETGAKDWGESSGDPVLGNQPQPIRTTREEQNKPQPGSGASKCQQSETQAATEGVTTVGPEPTKEQFDIPTTEEAYERMVDRFATVGMERWEVDKVIEAKMTVFNKACREHKKSITELKKKADLNKVGKNTRKNSLK